jgi:hypothetical protein
MTPITDLVLIWPKRTSTLITPPIFIWEFYLVLGCLLFLLFVLVDDVVQIPHYDVDALSKKGLIVPHSRAGLLEVLEVEGIQVSAEVLEKDVHQLAALQLHCHMARQRGKILHHIPDAVLQKLIEVLLINLLEIQNTLDDLLAEILCRIGSQRRKSGRVHS